MTIGKACAASAKAAAIANPIAGDTTIKVKVRSMPADTTALRPPTSARKAFSFNPQTQLLSTLPTSHSPEVFGFPGPTPAISSNGTSNGIVWAIERQGGGGAVLRAYNATNLGIELYNTTQNPSRDSAGTAVKFAAPTVADGHVFVGAQNQVSMYGLLQ